MSKDQDSLYEMYLVHFLQIRGLLLRNSAVSFIETLLGEKNLCGKEDKIVAFIYVKHKKFLLFQCSLKQLFDLKTIN